jgi:hypothetical protein
MTPGWCQEPEDLEPEPHCAAYTLQHNFGGSRPCGRTDYLYPVKWKGKTVKLCKPHLTEFNKYGGKYMFRRRV